MANVNVTYEEMRAAGTKLVAGQAEIEDKLAGLKAMIDALVGGGYVTDSSSKAFQAAFDSFNTGTRQVLESLTDMSAYLNTAAQSFSDVDTQLAGALRR